MVMLCFVLDLRSLAAPLLGHLKQDAAENCVLVEFVSLEQKSSHLADVPGNINKFLKQIGDLENCSFQNYVPVAYKAAGDELARASS
ncbi:hypothetical protein RND71_005353 [Anisodus tanguticus]|uniref:Uncharacterized protein n=1 Tax=Anisodus tanguticus TaxID=243964 RepID=A0AAE1SU02_9SOLA|nr:hypothetical protein RND71_005353 [Anisodus tanguticus]